MKSQMNILGVILAVFLNVLAQILAGDCSCRGSSRVLDGFRRFQTVITERQSKKAALQRKKHDDDDYDYDDYRDDEDGADDDFDAVLHQPASDGH